MFIGQQAASLSKKLFLLVLIVVLNGCAAWTRIDTPTQEASNGKYRVQAPIGWVRLNHERESILVTRDGLPIQHIRVTQQSDENYFKQTKVKLANNVLASDLAQLMIAEMRSDKSMANLVVKQNVPFTVAGQPGFKVHLQYRDERGTLFDRIVLGAAKGKDVVAIVYHALNTHYFGRDLDAFYSLAKSFQS